MTGEMMHARNASRALVYFRWGANLRAAVRRRASATSSMLPRAPNLAHRIYGAVTLFAGYVFFNKVGMLQPHEFDGEAIFDVPDNTALRLADGDNDADWRPQFRRDADRRTQL